MNLYITRNGQRLGPYSIEEARRLRATGEIQNGDLAWHEGLADWIPLGQVAGIALPSPTAGAIAPPLPAPLAPIPAQSDPTLLLRRLATAFVLFVILLIVLFILIFVVAFVIGAGMNGAHASTVAHAQGFDQGYKIGQEAGRKFAHDYTAPIAGVSFLVSLLLSALLSFWIAFSKLLPWCRPKVD